MRGRGAAAGGADESLEMAQKGLVVGDKLALSHENIDAALERLGLVAICGAACRDEHGGKAGPAGTAADGLDETGSIHCLF